MDWLLGRRSQSEPHLHNDVLNDTPQQSLHQSPPPPPTTDLALEAGVGYDVLLAHHDPARLHPLAQLDKDVLDYIQIEEDEVKDHGALPTRGWTDDLCYGTGATYLTGFQSF